MEDKKIIESLITERYENLNLSVRDALHRMKRDGLVAQLELHRTSTPFAGDRLYEVLDEFMNCWREKYIQKLQHDTEEAEITHDQILYKFQRVQSKLQLQNKEAFSQLKLLKKKKQELTSNISTLETQIKQIGKGFGNLINGKNKKITTVNEALDIIKDDITALRLDINSMKSKFSSDQALNLRQFKNYQANIKSEVSKSVFGYDISQNETYEQFDILQREEEITKIKVINTKLQSSLKSLVGYLNSLSTANNLPQRVDESNSYQNITTVLNNIFECKSKEHISTTLQDSGSSMKATNFVEQVKSEYDEALLKKQREIDEIIKQTKMRRKKLESDLQKATRQLAQLRNAHQYYDDDNDIFNEIQKSRRDYEATSHILDETMNKLGMHSSSSRSTIE